MKPTVYRFECVDWARVKKLMVLLRSKKYKFKTIDIDVQEVSPKSLAGSADTKYDVIVTYTV